MDTATTAPAYAQDRNGPPARMGNQPGLPVPMPNLSGQANGLVGKFHPYPQLQRNPSMYRVSAAVKLQGQFPVLSQLWLMTPATRPVRLTENAIANCGFQATCSRDPSTRRASSRTRR